MLDRDLAALYKLRTKVLKQAVKRYADRMWMNHKGEMAKWIQKNF